VKYEHTVAIKNDRQGRATATATFLLVI